MYVRQFMPALLSLKSQSKLTGGYVIVLIEVEQDSPLGYGGENVAQLICLLEVQQTQT